VPALWPCPQIAAVGINCVHPAHTPPLLKAAAAKIQQSEEEEARSSAACGRRSRGGTPLQLVCYPNSGEAWDAGEAFFGVSTR